MRKAGMKALSIVTALVACAACGQEPDANTTPVANAAASPVANAAGAPCPTQAEVEGALSNYVNTSYWSPSQRETWKITAVDGFTFTPMQVGNITKKQVEFGQLAQDVCPLRITYAFNVHHADGRNETTQMGADKTHLFYKDPFGGWIFRAE